MRTKLDQSARDQRKIDRLTYSNPTIYQTSSAHDLVDEFDALMQRAHKSGILTTAQVNRLSDYITREIAARYETEERLLAAQAERQESERLAAMTPRKRASYLLTKRARAIADATI